MPLQLAPSTLTQPILPNWSFSLFSVNLGATSNAAVEQEVIQDVGSYGKQIGHLAEALEVVIKRLKLLDAANLSQGDRDAMQVFLGDVAAVRKIKVDHKQSQLPTAPQATSSAGRGAAKRT
jgi:hypothetical protein